MPVFSGEALSREGALFYEYGSGKAVRDGKWKLIRVRKLGSALYDLEADISESNNLAEDMPERVAAMTRQLEKWEEDKIDPLWQEQNMWIKARYKWHHPRF